MLTKIFHLIATNTKKKLREQVNGLGRLAERPLTVLITWQNTKSRKINLRINSKIRFHLASEHRDKSSLNFLLIMPSLSNHFGNEWSAQLSEMAQEKEGTLLIPSITVSILQMMMAHPPLIAMVHHLKRNAHYQQWTLDNGQMNSFLSSAQRKWSYPREREGSGG